MPLSDDDVREILRIIDDSDLNELRIDTDGFSLHVLKGDRTVTSPVPREARQTTAQPQSSPSASTEELTAISAPMLGTFYRAEAPGKPPFVEVGSRVEPDTIVCIIEVMKMMNSVPAGMTGTIAEVVPDNAALVEFGQPLFLVREP